MSGIAGINKPDKTELVKNMLDTISYRGKNSRIVFSTANSTMGTISTLLSSSELEHFKHNNLVSHNLFDCHYSIAREVDGALELKRDVFGVIPLYYGYTEDGSLCFASEIKALLAATKDIKELPPGAKLFKNQLSIEETLSLPGEFLKDPPDKIAARLKETLKAAVTKRITETTFGSWLSGGLDSSAIAALARPELQKLYTFAGGIKNSPDLFHASLMAEYLKTEHFEVVVKKEDLLAALPEVIFHLESFDPYLVRSSVMNYLMAKKASDYVDHIFSGEGGDELFGGYSYLKNIPLSDLPFELLKITNSLHNTALQRVDRSSSAFGLVAHLPFLDPEVVNLALKILPELKIRDGLEKWILRQALKDYLPESILNRAKAKFWEGTGVQDIIAEFAESRISDEDFRKHRQLENGYVLRTKEEYYYYRIFQDHFGQLQDFSWLGFTKMD